MVRVTTTPRALVALILGYLLVAPGVAAQEPTTEGDSVGTLAGRIVLLKKGKPASESARALIYFEPSTAVAHDPPEEPFEIVTLRKQFTPESMIVPVGSTVRFPNEDAILHNVFSVSGKNRFDVGLYRRGEGKEVTFEHPGLVRIFCNVHHSMVSYLMVVDTPYFTTSTAEGEFQLDDLPAGSGTLTVWHPRTEPWSRELSIPDNSNVKVPIEVTKPRVPKHQNKEGKPYARRRGRKAYD